jgi:hypothetical protein
VDLREEELASHTAEVARLHVLLASAQHLTHPNRPLASPPPLAEPKAALAEAVRRCGQSSAEVPPSSGDLRSRFEGEGAPVSEVPAEASDDSEGEGFISRMYAAARSCGREGTESVITPASKAVVSPQDVLSSSHKTAIR